MLDTIQKFINFIAMIILLVYASLFISFNFLQRDNFVDKHFRHYFIKYEFTRYMFFLRNYGDLRFEYLSEDTSEVLVEIDYQRGFDPGFIIEARVKTMIEKLLGKSADIRIEEEPKIANFDQFTDEQIKKILKTTRDDKPTPKQNYLHIIYLTGSQTDPTNVGWAVGADEIIIFKDTIDGLSNKPEVIQALEESTIKHEFGHLLGIPHIDQQNCVMSEIVEIYGESSSYQNTTNIPTEFCGESEVILDDYRKMID